MKDHDWDAGVITAPTCTEDGYIVKTCEGCGATIQENGAPATSHNMEPVPAKDATCATDGNKAYYYCVNCKTYFKDNAGNEAYEGNEYIIPATGKHVYNVEVKDTRVDATCTEAGSVTMKCATCDKTEVQSLEINEEAHSWNEGVVTTEPTCSAEGVKTYTCKHNEQHTKTEAVAIDETAHSWNEGVVTTEPTCSAEGVKTYTCKHNEQHTKTEAVAIDADAHIYPETGTAEDYKSDEANHWQVCTECGFTGPTTPHDYDTTTGKCVCGHKEKFKIAAANIKLGDSLDMFFYVKYSDLSGKDYYAEITRTYADEEPETIRVPYAEWEPYNSSMIRVAYNGLAAKEMTDELYVTIYSNDGTAVSETKIDSIKAYTMRIFDGQKDKTKAVLADMLNYGAEAQKYFEYNVDNLANADLTSDQQAYATVSVSPVDSRVKGDNYAGSTVTLKSEMYLTFYFKNITPDMYAEITYTDHYGNAEKLTVNSADFKQNGSMYGISATGLAVADGKQLVTCRVYDEAGNEVAYAVDSTESYVARMSETDAIFEAVMKFVVSAYNNFH